MSVVTRDIYVWREKDSLLNLKSRIELLFGVGINFASSSAPRIVARGGEECARPSEYEWINVSGSEEACFKTQQYVLATFRPDCSLVVPCGVQFANLLFNGSPQLRDAIEKEHQALLLPAPNGILVQGSSHSVSEAVVKLRKLMETVDAGTSPAVTNVTATSTTALKQDASVNNLEEQIQNLVIKDGSISDSVKQAILHNMACSTQRQDDKTNIAYDPHSSSPSLPTSQREKIIQQFVHLGYPREKVEAAVDSLGIKASDNDIMARLVSMHSHSQTTPFPKAAQPKVDTLTVTAPVVQREGLRPIVIDGSNIAMTHGNGVTFSCRGIMIAVNWFLQRGHTEITVFVPQWRKEPSKPETPISDQEILFEMAKANYVVYTPSRRVRDRKIVCYDDRFIIRLAAEKGGVIVSNDHFRDLLEENPAWTDTIENRLLMYTFAGDSFMVPSDPMGKHGPHLDSFLRFEGGRKPYSEGSSDHAVPRNKEPCPYKERCNFGPRCRYYHPEREVKTEPRDITAGTSPSHEPRKDDLSLPIKQQQHPSPTKLFSYGPPPTSIESPIWGGDRPGGLATPHRGDGVSPTFPYPRIDPSRRGRGSELRLPLVTIPRGQTELQYNPTSESLRGGHAQYMPGHRFIRPEYVQVSTPTNQYYPAPDHYIDPSHRLIETAPLPQRACPPIPHPTRPHSAHISNYPTSSYPAPHYYEPSSRDHHQSFFDYAVWRFPLERERIQRILMQYPQINDINVLVQYLNR